MSDPSTSHPATNDPGPAPEPRVDADPDPGNEAGGTDAVEEKAPMPPVTPDSPLPAQLEEDLPEEVTEPEGPDTEANIEDPSTEPSA